VIHKHMHDHLMAAFCDCERQTCLGATEVFSSQPDYSHTAVQVIGVCRVDELYVNNGDDVIDSREVAALLRLEEFSFDSCDVYFWQSCVWLTLHGLVFRAAACISLHYADRGKKV
jgi:hypothetical protein